MKNIRQYTITFLGVLIIVLYAAMWRKTSVNIYFAVVLPMAAAGLGVVAYILARRELMRELDNVSDGVIKLDEGGHIKYMNSTAEELTGWNLHEAGRRRLDDILNIGAENNKDIFYDWNWGCVRGDDKIILKSRKNKTYKVSIGVHPERGWFGRRSQLVIIRDMTDGALRSDLFMEFQRRFQTMFKNAPLLISILTTSGKIIFANRSFAEKIERPYSELIRIMQSEILHPADVAMFKLKFAEISGDSLAVATFNARFMAGDNKIIYTEMTCFSLGWKNNRPKYIMCLAKDITDSIESEQIIEAEREQRRLIMDNIPEMILQVNQNFEVVWSNRFQHSASGDKIRCSDMICRNKYACVCCPVSACFSNGVPMSKEMTLDDNSCLLATASPLLNQDGHSDGVIVIAFDITEQKRQEMQLRHLQKMDALGKMAVGVAHDFNNLLQISMGYDTLIRKHLDDKGVAMWSMVMEASVAAKNLVRQLLTFSRKDLVMEMKINDLNEVLNHFQKMIRRIIGEQINLKLVLCRDELLIRSDVGLLEQVFMNLCVNARDAMTDGGSLTITTSLLNADHAPEIAKLSDGNDKVVCCEVTDTGHGIEPEIINKVFEPFFTTKHAGNGTGMGLAMVSSIINTHEGEISVKSEVAYGSTFRLIFPYRALMPLEHSCGSRMVGETLFSPDKEMKVLHVEDDENVRKIMREMLESEGVSVLEANNGDEAFSLLRKNTGMIQLVILDAILPGLSGRQIAAQLKKTNPELPIMFCSGYDSEFSGLDRSVDLISKPFCKKDLINKIRDILRSGTAA